MQRSACFEAAGKVEVSEDADARRSITRGGDLSSHRQCDPTPAERSIASLRDLEPLRTGSPGVEGARQGEPRDGLLGDRYIYVDKRIHVWTYPRQEELLRWNSYTRTSTATTRATDETHHQAV